jgi:energy-coupling factor transporter transmembrane protein EcfT
MSKKLRAPIIIALVGFAALALIILSNAQLARASAPSGLSSTVATSSKLAVSTAATTVIATSTNVCASRIIGTTGTPIMVIVGDETGLVPSGTLGLPQAASTTVVYDGGQFGCGAIKVYAFAATTIHVTETR